MNTHIALAITLSGLLASPLVQADVRPDPGDYTGLPAGTNLALGYAQFIRADDLYANGNKVTSDLDLDVNVQIFRFVHFTKLGKYIIDPQVIAPVAQQEIGLTGSKTKGLGDVIFGGTLWTIADLEKGEHLGYSVFLTAPTGADKNQGFAVSNDRWAADFQVGYIRRLNSKFTLDVIGEVEVYQDTRKTDLEKDPLLQAHTHLRYHLSDSSHLAASYRHAWGAAETPAGGVRGDKRDDNAAMLTWASFLTKQTQLQLQYVHDLDVVNGPKTRALQARVLYAF